MRFHVPLEWAHTHIKSARSCELLGVGLHTFKETHFNLRRACLLRVAPETFPFVFLLLHRVGRHISDGTP